MISIRRPRREVDAAASAAAAAYPLYRSLSAERRAQFLEAIADELDALGDDFVAVVCRETALPAGRIQGERGRTSGQMRLFAKVLRRGDFYGARIDRALPERQPLPRPDLRQYRIGLGPVAVFGASNFPLAFSTAGGDTASALAAGCPVVFKAHSGHMATAEWVADAIIRAAEKTGMPAGVFNMIHGGGVGAALVKHPAIQAVGFTGSLKGGRALCDMAAARAQPIPVFAEMSSINPVIVLPQALQARADTVARELTASVVQGCGQFCTNPGLVIGIRSAPFSAFVQQVAGLMGDQPAQTMLNAGTLSSYGRGLQKLLAHPGIEHLAGNPQQGNQAQPQLFKADVSLLLDGDEVLQEEVFGPTTVVVEVADHTQLMAALNGLHGQLTATVIGEPEDFGAVRRADGIAGTESRTHPAQWLSDGRGSLRFDGSRRALPGNVRCARYVGGHTGHRSFPAPGVLPELPGQLAAGCAEERQSIAHPATGGWAVVPRGTLTASHNPCGSELAPTGRWCMSYHCVFPIQRLIAMTAPTDTLLNALEHCGMVEIDGLHAFEFALDEDDNLHIECMDGRAAKHWEFTPAQIQAATFDTSLQSWLITGDSGEHRLVCLGDVVSGDNEDDDQGDA